MPQAGEIWKHLKSGGRYVVLGDCLLEASNTPAILYRKVNPSVGDPTWARCAEEFMDGRFVRVTFND